MVKQTAGKEKLGDFAPKFAEINDDILFEQLEPIPFKHPVANNKYEALSWCFKHEMWHSAEMEELKRMLGYPIKWLQR